MKKIQTVIASGVALALLSATTLFAAEAPRETKAIVRAVHGDVQYSVAGGFKPLRPNLELMQGTQIRTGPDSYVSLSVNGLRSSVRITENTTLSLSKMDTLGTSVDSDSDTSLKLDTGTVLGQVKKLSATSRYEIETPNGVAGIRGTDFRVSAIPRPDGTFRVTYTSVTGTVVASAMVGTSPETHILHTGESWTPGEGVVPTPQAQQQEDQNLINRTGTEVQQGTQFVTPPPPLNTGHQNGPVQTEGSQSSP